MLKVLGHQPADGVRNEFMVCPHCQTAGNVYVRSEKLKQGISGGKAVAALFTLGVSMLGVGLSRKQRFTRARCARCR